MFGWFRKLWRIGGSKLEAWVDGFENTKLALDQSIKDMHADIKKAKLALGTADVQAIKSAKDQQSWEQKVKDAKDSARSYLLKRDEVRAKIALRRSQEAQIMADKFKNIAASMAVQAQNLRDSIRSKEMKYEEARSNRAAYIVQQKTSESISKMNGGSAYSEDSNAFAEYERITEKISDKTVEAETLCALPSELGGSGDIIMIQASVDRELEDMKKSLGMSLLEDKSDSIDTMKFLDDLDNLEELEKSGK